MLNKEFLGMITAVSAQIKTIKSEDGTPIKTDYLKVKLESASIDYESIRDFNPSISSTLLNIQPLPFKSVNFGDQSTYGMMVKFSYMTEDDTKIESENYGNVMINNLTVNIKENIPVFVFTLDIPACYKNDFLLRSIKQKINFQFSMMEK